MSGCARGDHAKTLLLMLFKEKPIESLPLLVIKAVAPLPREAIDVLLCNKPVHAPPSPQRFVAAGRRKNALPLGRYRAETSALTRVLQQEASLATYPNVD